MTRARDTLLNALEANLRAASEPELVRRLREAKARLKALQGAPASLIGAAVDALAKLEIARRSS